jgi:3-oxoacid CoA-transferase subunit B
MDLAAGARRLVVLQSHASKDGKPKLVAALTLPLTALGCVDRAITELGVFDPAGDAFVCVERAPGVDDDYIRRLTGAPVKL